MYIFFKNGKNISLESIGGIFLRENKGLLIFLFCFVLFLGSFIFGYTMMKRSSEDPLAVERNSQVEDMEIIQEEDRISPNTVIELEIIYKKCNHAITKLAELDDILINMTEEEYRKYMEENFPNVRIVSFSSREIRLEEERDHICPNHYIVGEADGKVAIYKIDENGERYVYKIFSDYPISLLKEVDRKRLKEGIIVNSEEELSDVLENFIS